MTVRLTQIYSQRPYCNSLPSRALCFWRLIKRLLNKGMSVNMSNMKLLCGDELLLWLHWINETWTNQDLFKHLFLVQCSIYGLFQILQTYIFDIRPDSEISLPPSTLTPLSPYSYRNCFKIIMQECWNHDDPYQLISIRILIYW